MGNSLFMLFIFVYCIGVGIFWYVIPHLQPSSLACSLGLRMESRTGRRTQRIARSAVPSSAETLHFIRVCRFSLSFHL